RWRRLQDELPADLGRRLADGDAQALTTVRSGDGSCLSKLRSGPWRSCARSPPARRRSAVRDVGRLQAPGRVRARGSSACADAIAVTSSGLQAWFLLNPMRNQ